MNHWENYYRRWSQLKPPLRPSQETVGIYRELVKPSGGRVLLLGITPELALAFDDVVAIDKSRPMIDHIWPGNTAQRRAIEGNWLGMGEELGSFSAVVGDGSLNVLGSLAEIRAVLRQAALRLAQGARLVCRVFERPDAAITRDDLFQVVRGGARINFHAFKWRMAMSLAGRHGASVPVAGILELFAGMFPDTARLCAQSNWPVDDIKTIQAYRGSNAVYCFPNRAELLAQMPPEMGEVSFHPSGQYDLCERCPIMTAMRSNL